MTEHRWSGWPGAWCLDCGKPDPREIALADGQFEWDEDDMPAAKIDPKDMICEEPNSKRCDPYAKTLERFNVPLEGIEKPEQ